jgi:hypothetical protein
VKDDVEHAEADLEGASHHCLAHGSLLSLRYVLAELPWEGLAPESHDRISGFKNLLQQLTRLIKRLAELTLPVLALYQETYLGNFLREIVEFDILDSKGFITLGKREVPKKLLLYIYYGYIYYGAFGSYIR